MKGILMADKSSPFFDVKTFYEIFSDYNMEKLSEMIEISPMIVDRQKLEEYAALLGETELIFSTWGFGELKHG